VLASLALFAFSQANGASQHQVATLGPTPTAPGATTTPGTTTTGVTTTTGATPGPGPATVRPAGEPKRFIDDAAGVLTAPFRSLVHSNSEWARRIGYTLLALIVYGFGLGYLARWART
jgi:hypothetical protein